MATRDVLDIPIRPAMADAPHWGTMTVARHAALCRRGIYLHVLVGNEDVTRRCRWFDDTPGRAVAELYRLSPDGRHILRNADGDGPAMDWARAFLVFEGAPLWDETR